MANVYSITQTNLGDGLLDLSGHALLKARAILDTVLPVFDENDATMADVMNNGGSPITASVEAEVLLTATTVTQVSAGGGGTDYGAAKVTYTAVAGGETWAAIIIYDATSDATDTTRIPIAFYDITDTATNGSDIDILWSGTDPGNFMTSRNV